MGPTNQIGFLLHHVTFALTRQNDQVLQERMGIGFSQFKILRVLESQPHIQQRQIAEALGQTEASISRQIKLLHEKGLLQTVVDPKNRRKHITTLTQKGARFAEEAISILAAYHKPMFDQLSAKQQDQLLQILQVLHDHSCMQGILGACRPIIAGQPGDH
jgi:DNA-binding MarR family transcriptional regulator